MSNKLKLTDREWREFVFGDLFDISSTSSSIDKKRLTGTLGNNPYITRSENNNGIDSFIDKQVCFPMDEANVITIGLDTQTVFYQSFPFYTGQNIQVVRHPLLNKYNALFVIRLIKILVQKFSWGSYGATLTRLKRGKLFLPIDTNHLPDWDFMEAYMKQVEDELLSEVRPKLEEQLLDDIITLCALEDREWKEFYFSDVFTRVQRGKRLKKDDHIEGTTPYVSSTATNNGIDGFVGNRERVRIFSDCISLANSGSVGSAFFQEFEFVASDHITSLQKEGIDKYTYLFMLPIISRLSEKYSFNREINDLRISRERLMLPIQADGTPDWDFMSAFMKKVEQDTLSEAFRHFKLKKSKQMLIEGGVK
ncbi:restriction endonuclease subunit S [Bacteroides pyogenes]|uniref:restriction endonuclease subunit S n=2 Tax=Bacteroides pyogenes TaxID=310300 RepID=UPI0011E3CD9E|nr:restriction endonuclease subunit S [Bacteroides pyogenes]TYK36137.1 restriction endonuclease subunit S [Bacteroides pyogenes]